VLPATTAYCWTKVCIFPLAMEDRMLAERGGYCASSRSISDVFGEIIGTRVVRSAPISAAQARSAPLSAL